MWKTSVRLPNQVLSPFVSVRGVIDQQRVTFRDSQTQGGLVFALTPVRSQHSPLPSLPDEFGRTLGPTPAGHSGSAQ